MPAGAAELAARRLGATLVDPRPYAQGSIRQVFADYPKLGAVLPAVGYGTAQIAELARRSMPSLATWFFWELRSICGAR